MPTILACLALCFSASAQDEYLFVDHSRGTTNGPFTIQPNASVQIGGKEYTLRPVSTPLQCESEVIPSVDHADATLRTVVDAALLACGITNTRTRTIVIFQEPMVTNRVTLTGRSIRIGELVQILCDVCDLTLVRDRRDETLILIPNAVADDRTARVFGILPSTYDHFTKTHGSFNRLLVEVGVIRRESHMLCEFQRDRSIIILYGSREALRRFELTSTIWNLRQRSGQQAI